MPDERLRIVIEEVQKGADELKELQSDYEGVETAANSAGNSTKGFNASLKDGVKNLAMTAARLTAVGVAAKKAFDFGAEGAQIERIAATFEKVSGGAERAAINLEALRAATRGAVSDTNLMEGATNILALGLADTSEEMASITRNVAALGSKFGGTMQIFQLMMSNKSLARIDSFGLGMEEVKDRMDELASAGMDMNEAFDVAVLEAMNAKFEELGGNADDGALAIERMNASAQNLGDTLKKQAAPAAAQLADNTNELLTVSQRAIEEYGFWGVAADILVEGLLDVNDTIHTQLDDAEQLISIEQQATDRAAAHAEQQRLLAEEMRKSNEITIDLGENTYTSAQAFYDYTQAIAGSEQANAAYYESQVKANDAANSAQIAFLNAAAGLGELTEAALARQELDLLKQELDAGRISLDEYRAATDSVLTGMGLLTAAERDAQSDLDFVRQQFINGKISAEEYADAIGRIKARLDGLEDKSINVKFIYTDEDRRQGAGSGYSSDMWDPNAQGDSYNAAGGFIPMGGSGFVGEPNTERVTVTPAGTRVTPVNQTTNSINNYFPAGTSPITVTGMEMALYG